MLAFFSKIGVSSHATATGWWLALLVALVITALTAVTGLIDWLGIERWTPLWKTATLHMLSMLSATVFFLVALLWGHEGYTHAAVHSGPFALALIGFGLLTLGGWLGGAIVFVHGMRVLSLVDEPTAKAVAPVATPEKEKAEGALSTPQRNAASRVSAGVINPRVSLGLVFSFAAMASS